MSGHRAFSVLAEQSPYVKALYYAFGRNDAIAAIGDRVLTDLLFVDPVAFADAYSEHCSQSESHIAVQDCFVMFRDGKEFKR